MPKYEVIRGFVEREGAFLTKGSSFNAPESEVQEELRKGIIVPAKKSTVEKSVPTEAEPADS